MASNARNYKLELVRVLWEVSGNRVNEFMNNDKKAEGDPQDEALFRTDL